MEFFVVKIYFDVDYLADKIISGASLMDALDLRDYGYKYRNLLDPEQQRALSIAVFEKVIKKIKEEQEG